MATQIFENPSNGYRIEAFTGLTPLWAFLFGPLHALYRGLWQRFVCALAVAFTFTALAGTAGIAIGVLGFSIFHALTARMALEQKYKEKGWLPVKNGTVTNFKDAPSKNTGMEEEIENLNRDYAEGKITLPELLARKKISAPRED
jgi:hypothetical protein